MNITHRIRSVTPTTRWAAAALWAGALVAIGSRSALAEQRYFAFSGTVTSIGGEIPAPWYGVAVGQPMHISYKIDTAAPDQDPDTRFGHYACSEYRVQIGSTVFTPTGTQEIYINNPPNQDSYLASADLLPQYPFYQFAQVTVDMADDSAGAFSSDAQQNTLPFAAFTTFRTMSMHWQGNFGQFASINASLTGYTSSAATAVLAGPGTGSYVTILTPTLSWLPIGIGTYTVQVSSSTDFTTPLFSQAGVAGTSLTLPAGALPGPGEYFWRVLVSSASGTVTALGSPGNFAAVEPSHCPADFDHSGTLAIADIFAMLAAWFAGCP